jgi:hypothetical protein
MSSGPVFLFKLGTAVAGADILIMALSGLAGPSAESAEAAQHRYAYDR